MAVQRTDARAKDSGSRLASRSSGSAGGYLANSVFGQAREHDLLDLLVRDEALKEHARRYGLGGLLYATRYFQQEFDHVHGRFEVGENLAQMMAGTQTYLLHTHWTDLAVYQPDPSLPCLERGGGSLVVAMVAPRRPGSWPALSGQGQVPMRAPSAMACMRCPLRRMVMVLPM